MHSSQERLKKAGDNGTCTPLSVPFRDWSTTRVGEKLDMVRFVDPHESKRHVSERKEEQACSVDENTVLSVVAGCRHLSHREKV